MRQLVTLAVVGFALTVGGCGGGSGDGGSDKGGAGGASASGPRKLEPISLGRDSTGAEFDPQDLAAADGRLWTTIGGNVVPLDPATGKLAGAKPPFDGLLGPGTIYDIAAGDAGLWALADDNGRGVVYEVDADTGKPAKPIPIALDLESAAVAQSKELAVGAGRVWAAIGETSKLLVVDPQRGNSTTVKIDGYIRDIAAGADAAWVVARHEESSLPETPGTLVRVTPDGKQETFKTFADPTDVAAHGDFVWVLMAGSVARYTKYGRSEQSIDLRELDTSGVASIAAGDDGVWVLAYGDAKLVRIDVKKVKLDGEPLPTGDEPRDIAVSGGFAWLTGATGPLRRVRE